MILSEICRPPPDQLPTTDLNRTSEQISLHSSQSSSPRLGKHLQAIPEDETFEALDRPKTSQPSSICVKSASPNSKRVSLPHSHNSIGKFEREDCPGRIHSEFVLEASGFPPK